MIRIEKTKPICRRNEGFVLLMLAIHFLVSACSSVVYDMRLLQQPVTMNGNPFLMDYHEEWQMIKTDTFLTEMKRGFVSSATPTATGTYTQSSSIRTNPIQNDGFLKIGGDSTLTINNLEVHPQCMYVNLLFVLSLQESIVSNGIINKIEKNQSDEPKNN